MASIDALYGKAGSIKLTQDHFVGGDITPALTDSQIALIAAQREDRSVRLSTKAGTERVYDGVERDPINAIQSPEQALPPRTLEQATATANFLSRNDKPFYVVPDTRRPGGFLVLPEIKAKPYLAANQIVSAHGIPTPPKEPKAKPARARKSGAQPPAPDPEAIIAAPDPGPAAFIPPGPVPASQLNPFTGDPLHNADKPKLAGYCRLQMEGGGWGEECIQLVGAAIAQDIIKNSQDFADVVYTVKAVLYIDRASPPSDLAAFAEAIMYQGRGGMSAYLEQLEAETDDLTALNQAAGKEFPAGIISGNIAAGRRIIAVQAGIGQELPPPEAKPKRQRKKKAEPEVTNVPAPEIVGPLPCARCRVAECVNGPGNLCDKCEAILTNAADPLAYLSDMSEPDPFE